MVSFNLLLPSVTNRSRIAKFSILKLVGIMEKITMRAESMSRLYLKIRR